MHGCRKQFLVLAGLAIAACAPVDEEPTDQVFTHDGGLLSGGEQWAEGTHVVNGSLTIENGILEVAPCSVIELAAGVDIDVQNGGALRLVGTSDCPIRITSAKAAPAPGDWGSIDLYSSADGGNNVFDYVIIEYGGTDFYGVLWAEGGASFAMTNSVVANNKTRGVELQDGVVLREFTGNSIVDNGAAPVSVHADDVGELGEGTYSPNGVEGIEVPGGVVEHSQLWKELGTPYLLTASVDVMNATAPVTLRIEEGVTIELGPSVGIDVADNAALVADGTAVAPITLTSAEVTPARGDWYEVDLFSTSAGSQFDHVVFEYGGSSASWGMLWLEAGAEASVTNCTFRHGAAFGVDVEDGGTLTAFDDNVMQDNAFGPVRVHADGIGMLGSGIYFGNDVDVVQVEFSVASRNATWRNLGVPYRLTDGLDIRASVGTAVITVAPGTIIEMGPGAILSVEYMGGLTLDGAIDDHVVITSAAPVPTSGSWAEIDIYAESLSGSNRFTYADIEWGGGDDFGQLWLDWDAGVTLDNVTFAGATCDVYFAQGAAPAGFWASGTSYSVCAH